MELFKDIETQTGGYLKLSKRRHRIQRKIKAACTKRTTFLMMKEAEGLLGTHFQENTSMDKMKAELELYPFVKQQISEKHLLEPISSKYELQKKLEQKRLKR